MFNLKIMYKDTSQEILISEFVRIILDEITNEKKENLYLEMKDEIADKDCSIPIEKIGYICINHYSYFSIDDFKDAYDTLATSRRSYGSIVSISDILNRLLSIKEERIYKELSNKYNENEKQKNTSQNFQNTKKTETSHENITKNTEKQIVENVTKDNQNEK